MHRLSSAALAIALVLVCAGARAADVAKKNVVVYKESGRYAGWPANYGIWAWGNEIVTGFYAGYYKEGGSYPIDREKPQVVTQARSVDGGETWTIEKPTFLDETGKMKPATPFTAPIDFTQPNFALIFRMEGSDEGFSVFCWSNDRGKTWKGPFTFPNFGRKGIFARTDYIVNGKNDLFAFMTAAKDEGGEGWPFVAHTKDGGMTWENMAWIGPQPGAGAYAIMPSTVRLSDSELVTMIRRRGRTEDNKKTFWVEQFRSADNAKTWTLEPQFKVTNDGNPASMIALKDGRLAVTYGFRLAPYGVRAQLSADKGKTWGDVIYLRADGGTWDLGYPRTVQRADGKIVTVYYFNEGEKGERSITATIWDPGKPAAR